MKVNLPELDQILSRLNTLEEIVSVLQKGGKEPVKEWFSVNETAAYLSCSTKTVRRLIARGVLKRSLGLRHIRISTAELQEYRKRTVS